MNKLKILVSFLLLLVVFNQAVAQTKAEKKRMKQELKTYKKMKPEEIRSMKLNYENKLKDKNNQLQQSKQVQKKVDSLQSVINNNTTKISSLEAQLQVAQNEAVSAKKGVARGYYYRVQLGAYRNFESKSKPSSDDESFLKETISDMDKFTVGMFTSLEEADEFKDEMRKLGVKDAFVVPYKDGKRITHKEALEGLRKQNGGKLPGPKTSLNTAPVVPLKKLLENPSGYYAEYVLISIRKFEDIDNIIDISYASNYSGSLNEDIESDFGRSSKPSTQKGSRPSQKSKRTSTNAVASATEGTSEKGGDESGSLEEITGSNTNSSKTEKNTNRESNSKLTQEDFSEILTPGNVRRSGLDVRKLTYKELEDAAFSSRQVC